MALFDCGLMISAYYGLKTLLIGGDLPRYGNAHRSIVPYGVLDAADGPLIITAVNDSQYGRFCREVIERPDLGEGSIFQTHLGD